MRKLAPPAALDSIRPVAEAEHARFLTPEENAVFRGFGGRVVWLHLSGPISFGAANEMTRRISAVGDHQVMVIDLLDVPRVDGSAALAIEEIIQRAASAGQEVIIVGLNFAVARLLIEIGALDKVKDTSRFATRAEALSSAQTMLS